MMTDDEDANAVVNDAKPEVIWKAVQVHASKISLANHVRFRRLSRPLKTQSQLRVELARKLRPRDIFVVAHDVRNVGIDFFMELKPH